MLSQGKTMAEAPDIQSPVQQPYDPRRYAYSARPKYTQQELYLIESRLPSVAAGYTEEKVAFVAWVRSIEHSIPLIKSLRKGGGGPVLNHRIRERLQKLAGEESPQQQHKKGTPHMMTASQL